MVEQQGPVAIVTGAGRGIGRAAAVELAGRGYRLALAARSEDQLRQTAERAGRGVAMVTDVTVPEQAERLVERTVEEFGRIDAVVHCAGLAPAVSAERMSVEQWREVIETNLSSAFYLAHAVWPVFRKQLGGVIVHISSPACRDPFPGFAAYGAAKAGLNLLSLVLAREGQAIGVRVHTIAPGAVETEMFRALASETQWPKERTLDPAEVARVIGACVSGELRHTSGEVIFMAK
jgi:NAD(P)-dependent dehydrogenase (short-subunit alcohol dehydrogenase family)